MAEKEMDEAENDVYDASNEKQPVNSDAWMFLIWNCACNGWRRRVIRSEKWFSEVSDRGNLAKNGHYDRYEFTSFLLLFVCGICTVDEHPHGTDGSTRPSAARHQTAG